MDRPQLGPGERALNRLQVRWRRWARGGAATGSLLALVLLGRDAEAARAARIAEADLRAARLAAGYLLAVAPESRPGRWGADARLLSAASALAAASFWRGHLQVWLDRTPLLPGDTVPATAARIPLVDPNGEPRGSVAAWGSVPADLGTSRLVVGLVVAVLAVGIALATGALVGEGRSRRAFTVVALLGLGAGVVSVLSAVRAATIAAMEDGLLRTRRVIEVTAVGGRLDVAARRRLTAGYAVTDVADRVPVRDTAVVREGPGASVVVVASRGRAWRLRDDGSPARLRALRLRLYGVGLLALLGALGAAALPTAADYLSSPRHPRAPA